MLKVKKALIILLEIGFLVGAFSCQSQKEAEVTSKPTDWKIFNTPTEASLRGLSPVSDEVAWASGSGGTWLRTVDGGETWETGVIGGMDTVDFRSIHAFDAENAIAVTAGQPAQIYKTSDGGKNWELKLAESEQAFFDGISFADENRGYVFGDPVDGLWMIYETLDQGNTWTLLDSLPKAEEGEAGFAASASSLSARGDDIWLGTGGSYSFLHHSPDRGKTWFRYSTPIIQGESSQGIFSLVEVDNEEIVVVGGDYLKPEDTDKNWGVFDKNTKAWKEKKDTSPRGYRSGITYFSKNSWLIAVGPSGSDYSENGGGFWQKFSSEGFHAVFKSRNGESVWASGAKGKVAKLIF
ncbi:WD40/YVTN/BNR-like repeat-containing protein [Algoriphagus limi]|uniref:YCF48-related protein n=1 Tax=Algoriphagus limi TaxID=2975273 RepID=A0ABT2G6E2_9BACT|nr:YCF48-related protein [Algoriphagus limi]MCS5490784.1 YCF48-related protein [Algoriphagus limi]